MHIDLGSFSLTATGLFSEYFLNGKWAYELGSQLSGLNSKGKVFGGEPATGEQNAGVSCWPESSYIGNVA